MSCEGYGYELASGQGNYCNGDPVNGLDPDGRLGKGGFEAIGGSGDDYDAVFGGGQQGVATGIDEPTGGVVDGPGMSPDEETSQILNVIPLIGGLKLLAQGMTGYDFVTGQYVSDQEQLTDAAFGLASLAPGAAAEESAVEGGAVGEIAPTVRAGDMGLGYYGPGGAPEEASTLAKPIFCFPPGTKVLLADGTTKAIEDMRVGDEVASDDVTKACAHIDRPVTQLHKNWTKRLIHISISSSGNGKADGELQATGEHPIWTQNRGWVNAKDLVAGDKLLDPKGKEPAVVSVTSVPTVTSTYNLSIEGTQCVLRHGWQDARFGAQHQSRPKVVDRLSRPYR